ncbi:MAG: DUF4303 domain-containing protein [bacterium]|nr:DUF4303 domain-containing protein [bacterium]
MLSAARKAFTALLEAHPTETFYYLALVTAGGGEAPTITAWSREALARTVETDGGTAADLKWSYADSPYHCFGEEHFAEVWKLLDDGDATFDPLRMTEQYELVIAAMETAMARLDSEHLFGTGEQRLRVVINAEVMPPDHTNVHRAKRLNPPAALSDWLIEAAES